MTHKIRKYLFFFIMTISMAVHVPIGLSGTPHQKGSLKGFTGLHVLSPQLPPKLVSIDSDKWKVNIQEQFQQANIAIVNAHSFFTGKTTSPLSFQHRLVYLFVSMDAKAITTPHHLYQLRVTGYNKMDVFATPNPQQIIWEAGTLVTDDTEDIKAQTESLIKEFIKDFHRANPNDTLNITQPQ